MVKKNIVIITQTGRRGEYRMDGDLSFIQIHRKRHQG